MIGARCKRPFMAKAGAGTFFSFTLSSRFNSVIRRSLKQPADGGRMEKIPVEREPVLTTGSIALRVRIPLSPHAILCSFLYVENTKAGGSFSGARLTVNQLHAIPAKAE